MTTVRFMVSVAVVLLALAFVLGLMVVLWSERGGDPGDPDYVDTDTDNQDDSELGETDGWSEEDDAAVIRLFRNNERR